MKIIFLRMRTDRYALAFEQFSAFEYDTNAAKTYAGNLWTCAWFFDSSFMVYVRFFPLLQREIL